MAALVLASGCTSKQPEERWLPFTMWLSPDLSPEKKEASIRAAERWNEIAGREAVVVNGIGRRDEYLVKEVRFPLPGIPAGPGNAGYYADVGLVLVAEDAICPSMPNHGRGDIRCFEAIVMHEMGHMMSVEHVEHGVMQEVNLLPDTTDEDRAACMRAFFCGGLTSRR